MREQQRAEVDQLSTPSMAEQRLRLYYPEYEIFKPVRVVRFLQRGPHQETPNILLNAVSRGKRDVVENILKEHPDLLLKNYPGTKVHGNWHCGV